MYASIPNKERDFDTYNVETAVGYNNDMNSKYSFLYSGCSKNPV